MEITEDTEIGRRMLTSPYMQCMSSFSPSSCGGPSPVLLIREWVSRANPGNNGVDGNNGSYWAPDTAPNTFVSYDYQISRYY